MKNVLLISGSLREASFNTALLRAFAQELQGKAEVARGNIELPLFNQELEADFPAAAQMLKDQILAADAIIIATPEYNRGVPGVLKNALDWTSRPYGQNAWAGKRVLVASASVGPIAGALAYYQLKQTLQYLDTELIGQPEFFLGLAGEKFSESGELTDETTKEYIAKAVEKVLG